MKAWLHHRLSPEAKRLWKFDQRLAVGYVDVNDVNSMGDFWGCGEWVRRRRILRTAPGSGMKPLLKNGQLSRDLRWWIASEACGRIVFPLIGSAALLWIAVGALS